MDPPALSRGSRVDQHASGQRQSDIRPLSEDLPWSSGPDDICASSPTHDRGLRGPVPTQVGRKPVGPIVSSTQAPLAWCGRTPRSVCPVKERLTYLPTPLLLQLIRVAVLLRSWPADRSGGSARAPSPSGHCCLPPPRRCGFCHGVRARAASTGCVGPSSVPPSGSSPARHAPRACAER
jgi:hypothetical protein